MSTTVAVIGAGQAGLSAGYFLRRRDLIAGEDFVIVDHSPIAGGAWQFRWPTMTVARANAIADLPGLPFDQGEVSGRSVAEVVPEYYAKFEAMHELDVRRPVHTQSVTRVDGRFRIDTSEGDITADGIINATGTWDRPFWPRYPGAGRFTGRQLHTHDYRGPEPFAGERVLIVGGGVSAMQFVEEIATVARVSWMTRRPLTFTDRPLTHEIGREAVQSVEKRVRAGLPPKSVVSVTGLPLTPRIKQLLESGDVDTLTPLHELTENGARWDDGTVRAFDTIVWCTGFRAALDHLTPLHLRSAGGGITMTGRLATKVAVEPRLHLVGYGPSASTIGANRAGRAAVSELLATLRT